MWKLSCTTTGVRVQCISYHVRLETENPFYNTPLDREESQPIVLETWESSTRLLSCHLQWHDLATNEEPC